MKTSESGSQSFWSLPFLPEKKSRPAPTEKHVRGNRGLYLFYRDRRRERTETENPRTENPRTKRRLLLRKAAAINEVRERDPCRNSIRLRIFCAASARGTRRLPLSW